MSTPTSAIYLILIQPAVHCLSSQTQLGVLSWLYLPLGFVEDTLDVKEGRQKFGTGLCT